MYMLPTHAAMEEERAGIQASTLSAMYVACIKFHSSCPACTVALTLDASFTPRAAAEANACRELPVPPLMLPAAGLPASEIQPAYSTDQRTDSDRDSDGHA